MFSVSQYAPSSAFHKVLVVLDHTPIVSEFKNLIDLFLKCVWDPEISSNSSTYAVHIAAKSVENCLWSLVPLPGARSLWGGASRRYSERFIKLCARTGNTNAMFVMASESSRYSLEGIKEAIFWYQKLAAEGIDYAQSRVEEMKIKLGELEAENRARFSQWQQRRRQYTSAPQAPRYASPPPKKTTEEPKRAPEPPKKMPAPPKKATEEAKVPEKPGNFEKIQRETAALKVKLMDPTVGQSEKKKAFMQWVRVAHPDKGGDTKIFQETYNFFQQIGFIVN